MAMPLLLIGAAATAGASNISMPDFTIDRDGTASVPVTLDTGNENIFPFSGLQFDLFLPEGLSVKKFSLEPKLSDGDFSLSVIQNGTGIYRILAFTTGIGIESGELMTVTFQTDRNVSRGERKILIRNVIFSSPDGRDIDLDDSEATVFFNTFGKAETPLQLLRKGDGKSCTFICMMPLSNEQLDADGYKFVYGYDSTEGQSTLLSDTPLRYCHTTEEIYDDPSLDFWVFAYYTDAEGTFCVSERRHLNGTADDDFDPYDFIGASRNAETRSDFSGFFTLDGRFAGYDSSILEKGIYIYRTAEGSVKFIK